MERRTLALAAALVGALAGALPAAPAAAQDETQAQDAEPAPALDPSAPAPTPAPIQAQAPADVPAADDAAPAARRPVSPVVIINRSAVLEASAPARALAQVERQVQDRVRSENERVRAALEAEERELTSLRETLDPEAFEARTRDFDRRVRAERRRAQERGALLLRFMQDARAALASALPRVLEGLRRDLGAAVILDAGAVVAADPGLDVTAAAITRYNTEMGAVRFDPPAELLDP